MTSGLTLLVEKSMGIMVSLNEVGDLPVPLEGPDSNNPTQGILCCDHVILTGGGIGITGLLPWAAHLRNVSLCWSVKDTARCLVDAVQKPTKGLAEKY